MSQDAEKREFKGQRLPYACFHMCRIRHWTSLWLYKFVSVCELIAVSVFCRLHCWTQSAAWMLGYFCGSWKCKFWFIL